MIETSTDTELNTDETTCSFVLVHIFNTSCSGPGFSQAETFPAKIDVVFLPQTVSMNSVFGFSVQPQWSYSLSPTAQFVLL